MKKLGFVGLGTMGIPMAKRLLGAEYFVTGYNRTKSKSQELLELGMEWSKSPRGVAEASDVVFTMMADTEALMAVTQGPYGILEGLGPGDLYIDMGTVAPEVTRKLAAQAAGRGAQMLDAPVSGNAINVAEGRLSMMVGGPASALEEVRPILEILGTSITHVGTNGQGSAMKIANNLSLPVQILALSEGLLLAEKSGIPREIALEAMMNSVIASPLLRTRSSFFMDMPDEPLFSVRMIQKDLSLALNMGLDLGVPLYTASVTNQLLTSARGLGFYQKDFAVVFDTLQQMSEAGDPRADDAS